MARFVYPYNFVPPADQHPRPVEQQNKQGCVGEYKRYKELHRFEGRTGRIEFTLTNLSPLFIPDSEGATYYLTPERSEKGEPQYHRVMDFFNVDCKLAISGTSLKGMISNVAEALSNSCFRVFVPESKRFSFRKTENLPGKRDLTKRAWGRVIQDPKDGKIKIQPLGAAKLWRDCFDRAFGLTTDPDREQVYGDLRKNQPRFKAELWQLHTGNMHVRRFSGSYNGSTVTGQVFPNTRSASLAGNLRLRKQGRMEKTKVVCRTVEYKGPLLNEMKNSSLSLGRPDRWPSGGLIVSFQTVANVPAVENKTIPILEDRVCQISFQRGKWDAHKGKEDVIFWPHGGWPKLAQDGSTGNIHYIAALYKEGSPLSIADEAVEDYKRANGEKPSVGQIVRYYGENGRVVEFGPAAMFKTPERATVAEIAKQTPPLQPCRSNTNLCPASRLFGWTPEDATPSGDEKLPVSGRVRVGVAWSDKTLENTLLLPLQILDAPKPGYYPFYLRPKDGNASTEPAYYALPNSAPDWWHDTPGLLRGRKFYLHHPDAIFDPQSQSSAQVAPESPSQACDSVKMTKEMIENTVREPQDLLSAHNATAAVLPPGANFKGYIEFDSLADYELGLLLWAVSLADSPLDGCLKRAHKLGMGRPTGMGSVRLKITSISTHEPVEGWKTNARVEEPIDKDEAERLVKLFKTWMLTGINDCVDEDQVKAFDNNRFYQDLCEVLSLDLAGNDPVQYHPPNIKAYKGFDYFVEQRQRRTHKKGQMEEPLRTPTDLRKGLRQG